MNGEKILVVDDESLLENDAVRRLHALGTLNAVFYPITGVTLDEMIDHTIPRRHRRRMRPEVMCALPGCENMTTHRGGYCCAAHCNEHKDKFRVDRLLGDES